MASDVLPHEIAPEFSLGYDPHAGLTPPPRQQFVGEVRPRGAGATARQVRPDGSH